MKKRDKVAIEMGELHDRYWKHETISKQLYDSEVRRIRFRWLIEYTER
tara:strand:+ start:1646 stop:1789 length:144 start_codon:yes stop_codon:yes gene_type:complete